MPRPPSSPLVCLRPATPSLVRPPSAALPSRRFFFAIPGDGHHQHLTANRTLPYAHEPLYDLIADVDSYRLFVPYCSHSRVTQWSQPDDGGRRWPTLADLHVGWGGFSESFTSHLRCLPGISVEAISGGPDITRASPTNSTVFKSLVTRWSLRPIGLQPSPSTEVHLSIHYQFLNPIYAALSAAVSDRVAGLMIEAFEKRAREKLGTAQER